MPMRARPPPPPPPPLLPPGEEAVDASMADDDIDGVDDVGNAAFLPGPEIRVTSPAPPPSRRPAPPPPPPSRSLSSSSSVSRSGFLRRNEPSLLRGSSISEHAPVVDDLESTLSSAGGHVDDDEVIAREALATTSSSQRVGVMGGSPLFSSPKTRTKTASGRGLLMVPGVDGSNNRSPASRSSSFASTSGGLSTSQRSGGSLSIDITEDLNDTASGSGTGANRLQHRPGVVRSRTLSGSSSFSARRSRSRSPSTLLRASSILRAAGVTTTPSTSPISREESSGSVDSRAVFTGADETDATSMSAPATPSGPIRSRSAGIASVTPPALKSPNGGMILRRTSSAVVSRGASAGRLSLLKGKNAANSSLLPVVSPHALVKKSVPNNNAATSSPTSGVVGKKQVQRQQSAGAGVMVKRGQPTSSKSAKNRALVARNGRALTTATCRGCSAKNCPARKRRNKVRRITHTVKLCFGNDLLSLALHILAFLIVITITLHSKRDVDRATAQLEHYRDEERRVNAKIREFENRAARLTGEVERLRLDNERMEKVKKEEELKIKRKKEEEKMVKEMEEKRVELKRRDKAVREQVKILERRISVESRREAEEKFGPGPHKVEIALDFPGQPTKDDSGRDLPYKFHVELAPLAEMPHSVHHFLEQVHRGLWDGTAFVWNPSHLILASPHVHLRGGDGPDSQEIVSDDDRRDKFREVGFDRVSFQEYSPTFPHKRYTLGLAGRPGGPNFYVNVKDNSKIHGPGGRVGGGLSHSDDKLIRRERASDEEHDEDDDEDDEVDADPCFGKVVAGFDAVDRMHSMPTYGQMKEGGKEGWTTSDEEDGGWKKDALVNDVVIRYAKILGAVKKTSGGGGGGGGGAKKKKVIKKIKKAVKR